jgi:hypothetical protein
MTDSPAAIAGGRDDTAGRRSARQHPRLTAAAIVGSNKPDIAKHSWRLRSFFGSISRLLFSIASGINSKPRVLLCVPVFRRIHLMNLRNTEARDRLGRNPP